MVEGVEGAWFENLVANHFLKKLHSLEDPTPDKYEPNFLKDKTGHEIDFLNQKNKTPVALIEEKFLSPQATDLSTITESV